jgi:hypothetical protein
MPLTDLGPVPATATWFSTVGILNQESGSSTTGTNGYELFVQEIGPVLEIGASGARLGFAADYEGYVLQYSDDGLNTWADVDAMPRKMIVIEDGTAPTSRMYRLIQKEE